MARPQSPAARAYDVLADEDQIAAARLIAKPPGAPRSRIVRTWMGMLPPEAILANRLAGADLSRRGEL